MDSLNHEGKYSMPIKQAYHANIKESREYETNKLLYEFFDDYSYSNSKFACIHYTKNKKNEYILYLAMEKGPQDLKSMECILRWRISGNSHETGHKGGGNKRLIYGHGGLRCSLNSIIDDDKFIRAETKPDDIFALSSDSTISEGDFQINVDRSYIKWPDIFDLDNDGAWFNDYRKEMKLVGLDVGYVMRFTLSTPRKEYIDKKLWRYLIAMIQMKNYTIPIHFKNEFLGETEFQTYPNIDMIGLYNKQQEQIIEIFLKLDEFVLKNNDVYTNIKGEPISFETNFEPLGIARIYKTNETHLKENITKLNNISLERKYNQEDFYGGYVILNDKQTNYLPILDILPLSKNVGPILGNSLCRIVIEPTCSDTILEKFIRTDTIKADTIFKHPNKTKKLMSELLRLAKHNIRPDLSDIPKKKKVEDNIDGQCYIIQIGPELYKYGYVTCVENMDKRMKSHKLDSIKKVKEFSRRFL
jgi:hypothetical protein